MKIQKLILVGGGGTCSDVLSIINSINSKVLTYQCIGILDDSDELQNTLLFDLPVLGKLNCNKLCWEDARYVDCLGSPNNFLKRQQTLIQSGFNPRSFESIISPQAYISDTSKIGIGSIIYPGNVLMSNVHIGNHVTILPNCTFNHNTQIGNFSIVTSGVNLSGDVVIGDECYIGTGSAVKHGIHIGSGSLIGMGSVVIQNISPNEIVAGNPAKVLKK